MIIFQKKYDIIILFKNRKEILIEIRNFFFIFLISMLLLIILTWLFTGIFTSEWEWDNNGANALFVIVMALGLFPSGIISLSFSMNENSYKKQYNYKNSQKLLKNVKVLKKEFEFLEEEQTNKILTKFYKNNEPLSEISERLVK